ncbi:MAG: alpha/beta hydrolase [bacterium]|nr:alpha/beta hydrolase [bacterium]
MANLIFNNSNIYYEITGNEHSKEDPLLFLHGWHGSSASFKQNLMDLLKDKYRVIILDLPGYGKSGEIELSFENIAALINSLLDLEQLTRVNLLGFCMGAVFSLDYAVRNPARVTKVMLVEAYINYPKIIYPLLIKKINYFLFRFFLHNRVGFFIMKKYLLMNSVAYREDFFETILNINPHVSLDYIRLLWDYSKQDHIDRIREVNVPVCQVVGEKSRRAILKENKKINSLIKTSTLVFIEGCKHFPIEENRYRLSEITHNFI